MAAPSSPTVPPGTSGPVDHVHGGDDVHPADHLHATDHVHDPADPACAMAHGDLPVPTSDRHLVLVFASPMATQLAELAARLDFRTALLDPDPERAAAAGAAMTVAELGVGSSTDVVVCDHDRCELGDVLAEVLRFPTRWVGVMGSLRHTAPHVVALRERGVAERDIARVHRPIGLDLGARSPAEIALATVAGLLADRNGRSGGPFPLARG